ncbi:MAG: ABC transporter ATP-binding protein [Planctomycetes bacterium]|nr:ABC transporter ATP-binding protein [Planctomycetota bacterium]MCW8134643.1 ABC transporter ATP-binding protein [Planctomycetota bacterium]
MRSLRFLLAEYKANLGWFGIGMTALIIGALLQTVAPLYIKLAVDAASPEGFAVNEGLASRLALSLLPMQLERSERFVVTCLGMVALIAVLIGIATFYKRYYLIRISRRTEYSLRKRMYARLQDMPGKWFDHTRSGGVMSLMTSDIEAVRQMIGPAIMYMGGTIFMFPAALAIMLSLNWKLTLLSLIPMLGLGAATLWFNPRVKRYSLRSQEDLEQLSARAQENFAGARVVKAFSREEFEIAEMQRLGDTYLANKLGQARNQALYHGSILGFSGLGVLIILYFGATEIGAGRSTVGDMAAFLLYNLALYWPMIALGWVTMLFVRAAASLKRIDAMMNVPVDASRVPQGDVPASLRGELELQNVSVRYSDHGPPALDGVSFRVAPGRTLGIVGPVGSGKSTIANLLLRMVDASNGRVLVDGKPIGEYNTHALRSFFGYVPQDSFLFSDTIASNIGLALPADDPGREAAIRAAVKAAEFESEVLSLPHGYDTMLGERGVNLSGGQKQRAAIARALAAKPAVLVFDDCLSAVDTDTEERILRNLKAETRDVSTVIIAQRISTVQHADEIIVLDDGKVIERGTDAELRARDGLYAALARRQELAAALA